MPSRRRLLRQLGTATGIGLSTASGVPAASTPQRSVTWPRRYGPVGTDFEGLVRAADGSVLLVGSNGGDLWLGSVAPDGELRWSTTVDEPERLFLRGVTARDGGYTVALGYGGSGTSMLIHFDDDGSEQWRRPLDLAIDRGLVSTAEGYLVYGTNYGDAAVALVDVDGSVRWLRTYDGGEVVGLRQVDDGLLLAGSSNGDAWVQWVADGGSVWNHTYGGIASDGATVCFPRGAGAVYGGWAYSPATDDRSRGVLVRVADDGARVWRRTYGIVRVEDARSLADGLVVVGRPVGGGFRSGRLLFVDEWGRVDRHIEYDGLYGAELARFGDGSLAVAGDTGSQINLVKVETKA